jgi:hypothetical protein
MNFKPSTKPQIQTVTSGLMFLVDTGTALYHLTSDQLVQFLVESISQPGGANMMTELGDVQFTDYNGKASKLLAVSEDGTGVTVIDRPIIDEVLSEVGANAVKGSTIYEALAGKAAKNHTHGIATIEGLEDRLQEIVTVGGYPGNFQEEV